MSMQTTQFKRTPDGVKTPRMLEVEADIGTTLEKDYKAYYLDGHFGQKKLAKRWKVARGLIFGTPRGRRRNWVEMLNLPRKGARHNTQRTAASPRGCEVCGTANVNLQKAHWIPARDGGSTRSDNMLKLCPNCHDLLDEVEDAGTTQRGREILLLRAVESLLQSTSARGEEFQGRLCELCASILSARTGSESVARS